MISMSSQQLTNLLCTGKCLEPVARDGQRGLPQQMNLGNEFNFSGIEIDSRKPCTGSLFVAIKGENFNGHDFIQAAADKGAIAAIVDHKVEASIPQIVVEDCKKSLGLIANAWRKKINPKVIAITGSNGKTTVKEMLGQILSTQQQTLKTAGNLNNDIGVPLTLFRLSPNDHYAVIEMGASHVGEIKQLMDIAVPDVVYANNARPAHVEGFGSLENIIRAKGEVYQYASPEAEAVFNDDEDAVASWKSISATKNQCMFSLEHQADISGSYKSIENGLQISVNFEGQQAKCWINVQGEHNASNAIAAISLAVASGLSLSQAVEGLEGFSAVTGRLQFLKGLNNSLIIDDSYNANPDSLAAAVKVLCALQGTAWLALGDMGELGEDSQSLHTGAAKEARQAGVDKLFALGEKSCQAAETFGHNGFCFDHHDAMAEFIGHRLKSNINLLIKGSRSAQMEKLVKAVSVNPSHSDQAGKRHAV